MQMKWIGAALVIAGCGGFGFAMARDYLRQLSMLRQLRQLIEYMQNDLRYNLTPLPELIRSAAGQTKGRLREIFTDLALRLECNCNIDAPGCVSACLQAYPDLPAPPAQVLRDLGSSLGCFDLDGQLAALEAARISCAGMLAQLEEGRAQRVRNYEILGLCAGGALAILLL